MSHMVYRVTKVVAGIALPAGREVDPDSCSDRCEYDLILKRLVIAGHINRTAKDVLTVLGAMVIQQGEHPTHARLADAVAAQTGRCSVSTVQRALQAGRVLGVVSWASQYDVAQRRDGRTVPSQTANRYTLHLPDDVPAVPVVMSRLKILRSRRLHSRDRPPRVGQNAGVSPTRTGLPLASMATSTERANRIAAHLAAQSAANRARMTGRPSYPLPD